MFLLIFSIDLTGSLPKDIPVPQGVADPKANKWNPSQRPLSFLNIDVSNKTPGRDPLFPSAPVDPEDPEGLGRVAEMSLLKNRFIHGGICHDLRLKNKYFDVTLPIWIDEFSYFKRPLNASVLKPTATSSKGSQSKSDGSQASHSDGELRTPTSDGDMTLVPEKPNKSLKRRGVKDGANMSESDSEDEEELSKPLLGGYSEIPSSNVAVEMVRGSDGANKSTDTNCSSDLEVFVDALEGDFGGSGDSKTAAAPNTEPAATPSEDSGEFSFLEDTKTWVKSYCSDEPDVRMVRDSLMAVIYAFDPTHPYPESLREAAGSLDLAAAEIAGAELGTASAAIAGTRTSINEPPSLAELDAIASQNKKILEQRHLNVIETHIKELFPLIEKLEDEGWDGLFLAVCRDVRDCTNPINPHEIAVLQDYKSLIHSDSANAANPSDITNSIMKVTPSHLGVASKESEQWKKEALETAHRVSKAVQDNIFGDRTYEVINLNYGPTPRQFLKRNRGKNPTGPVPDKNGEVHGLESIEMALSLLVTMSNSEKEESDPPSSRASSMFGSGPPPPRAQQARVTRTNAPDGPEGYDALSDEKSDLTKEINRVYEATVAHTGLRFPVLERDPSSSVMHEGSASTIEETEELIESLRNFRLNVSNMSRQEAQECLNKISDDMSRFF